MAIVRWPPLPEHGLRGQPQRRLAPGFKFSASSEYPHAVADLRHSFETLEKLPCDVLISAHPEASQLWERLEASATAGSDAFVDPQACHTYVAAARALFDARLEQEKQP